MEKVNLSVEEGLLIRRDNQDEAVMMRSGSCCVCLLSCLYSVTYCTSGVIKGHYLLPPLLRCLCSHSLCVFVCNDIQIRRMSH